MMKFKNLLSAGALAFLATGVSAQSWVEDSVVMGPGYASDVYYSLQNGAHTPVPNTDWHLAFQMYSLGYGNVGLLANHVQGGVKVYSLHMPAAPNFNNLSAADTIGKTGLTKELLNTDTSWSYGAFNTLRTSNIFDYGWGTYSMSTHNVTGDSLYLVTVTSGTTTEAYKIWPMKFVSTPADSVQWQFRIARFDGSDDTTVRIYRTSGFSDRLFAYYNMNSRTVSDREPSRTAWDILFTRYKEYLPGAPGVPYYSVMGVLSNLGVKVHQKDYAAPDDTLAYTGYTYNGFINEIGSDWKTFNNSTMQWTFADSTYYFVKNPNTHEYYQLHFTNFGGAADGKVVFRKRLLGTHVPTSVRNVSSAVEMFKLYPNPAHGNVSILLEAKETSGNAKLIVTDLTGRMVFQNTVNVSKGLNAFTLNTASVATGTYMVTVSNGIWKVTEKLVVQH